MRPDRVAAFDQGPYVRAEQAWVCGRAADGAACALGPDRRGGCRGAHACAPVTGAEGWRCTRSAAAGGPCDAGPDAQGTCALSQPPCRPRRRSHALRGLLCLLSASLTVGLLAWAAYGPARDAVFSPGDLTHAHADLACSACHEAAAHDAGAWSRMAFTQTAHAQSERACITCHTFEGAADPFTAHNLSPDDLAHRTAHARPAGDAAVPWDIAWAHDRGPDRSDPHALPCSTCHQEHRGRQHDLRAMSVAACQSCHAEIFASFHEGHPGFDDAWPHQRRAAIAYDHARHAEEHFPAAGRPAPRCTSCHRPDEAGARMTSVYARDCASCHEEDIRFEGDDALLLLQWPKADAQALGLADWPEDLGRNRAEISVVMRLLLGTEHAAWMALPADQRRRVRFRRLKDGEDPAPRRRLLEAWRSFLEAIDTPSEADCCEAVADRLEGSTGVRPTTAEVRALFGGSVHQAFVHVRRAWFGPEDATDLEAPGGIRVEAKDDAIRLATTDHAHPRLSAWLPWILRLLDKEGAFGDEALRFDGGPLQGCFKCHNVDRSRHGDLQVHWRGAWPGRLDRFVHGPHLGQPAPGDTDWPEGTCGTCHVPRPGADSRSAQFVFARGRVDPWNAPHDFEGIAKPSCDRCHKPGGDGPMSCLSCHRYHSGRHVLR